MIAFIHRLLNKKKNHQQFNWDAVSEGSILPAEVVHSMRVDTGSTVYLTLREDGTFRVDKIVKHK